MDLSRVGRIAQVAGFGLNIEETSGLEVAMLQRKLQENLVGNMFFWGKVFGTTQDYLVVHHIDPFAEFPDKKYYYCTTSDFVLRALPDISADYIAQAEKIRIAFTGDPSFFAYNGEEEEAEPEDPDAPPVERFREVHRLTFTVKKIDRECALVPRGALSLDTGKKVISNANYQGLSYETSRELRAYMHLRQPENLQGIALLKRPGIIKTDDFLDSIDKDLPKEMWSITHDNAGSTVHVRNLYWDGYCFYSVLKSSEYGSAYFGNGVPNYDIAFMM
mmetsp:Transcript_16707/g.28328  ORF Transcript_16707/g.28328 Transcript_16707/m.28328 type:complete len:275 (+) Transcript_16707:188-1012(+)